MAALHLPLFMGIRKKAIGEATCICQPPLADRGSNRMCKLTKRVKQETKHNTKYVFSFSYYQTK